MHKYVFTYVPVYDIQAMNIFKCKSYLSSVELSTFLRESSDFSQVKEQFTTATIIQNEKQFIRSLLKKWK